VENFRIKFENTIFSKTWGSSHGSLENRYIKNLIPSPDLNRNRNPFRIFSKTLCAVYREISWNRRGAPREVPSLVYMANFNLYTLIHLRTKTKCKCTFCSTKQSVRKHFTSESYSERWSSVQIHKVHLEKIRNMSRKWYLFFLHVTKLIAWIMKTCMKCGGAFENVPSIYTVCESNNKFNWRSLPYNNRHSRLARDSSKSKNLSIDG
jgi:hypothetical protein